MHKSLLASLALVCGALLFPAGAQAIPIIVGLNGAAGNHAWTSGPFGDPSYLHLSGWAWDDTTQTWVPATMTDGQDGNGHHGLGVCSDTQSGSNLDSNNVCLNSDETNEIDSIPAQMIQMDISDLEDWNSVRITLLSVDNYASILGASCSLLTTGCNPTDPAYLGLDSQYCSQPDTNEIAVCVFPKGDLAQMGVSAIWISSVSGSCPDGGIHTFAATQQCNSGILLGSEASYDYGFSMDGLPATVPEPSALGMLGLATLLMGLLMGLRRRRRTD